MKRDALLSLTNCKKGNVEFYEELNINENLSLDNEGKHFNVTIKFNDPRQITQQQRKFLYAMYYDIAIYVEGYCDNLSKAYYNNFFKQALIDNDLIDEHISLSSCSVTEANLLIDFVLEFVFRNNIPLRFETIKDYDDLERWQYMCIKYHKCCVCGKNAEIHHFEAIGIGHDRKKVDDSKYLKMALCRSHHQEIHSMPKDKFCEKYHVKPIVFKG